MDELFYRFHIHNLWTIIKEKEICGFSLNTQHSTETESFELTRASEPSSEREYWTQEIGSELATLNCESENNSGSDDDSGDDAQMKSQAQKEEKQSKSKKHGKYQKNSARKFDKEKFIEDYIECEDKEYEWLLYREEVDALLCDYCLLVR